jgi:hypothetical protein
MVRGWKAAGGLVKSASISISSKSPVARKNLGCGASLAYSSRLQFQSKSQTALLARY